VPRKTSFEILITLMHIVHGSTPLTMKLFIESANFTLSEVEGLTLALFMARVFTNDVQPPFSSNDFAVVTHAF